MRNRNPRGGRKPPVRISVLGCGRWGTFLAWYAARLGHDVCLWGRKGSTRFKRLRAARTNGLVSLGPEIGLTDQLQGAVAHGEVLLIAIASQQLRRLMARLVRHPLEGRTLVLCMKGLEAKTGKRLSQVAGEYAGEGVPIAIWVGPGHVQDFADMRPNCMVIDSDCAYAKKMLVKALSGDLIRFYYGGDMIGNEIGAASKNVIGIAAGMLDGLGLSSLKGALMARGTREISRLIGALGGNPISAYGLAHLGDYEATLFSPYSHNRQYGECFVRGRHYGELAEGVSAVRALLRLGRAHHVDLPICRAVGAVIHRGQDPRRALSGLFLRSLKDEF